LFSVSSFRELKPSLVRLPLIAAVAFISFIPAALAAADSPSATSSAPAATAGPESARAALAKWMATERIIAQERAEWQHSRDMLRSRIDLLKSEIEAQQEKTRQLRETDADLGQERAAVDADDRSAREALVALSEVGGSLEAAVRRLSSSFPEPLLVKVRPLLDRMPADPSQTKVSLAERFQNVVGILNEANKFDNDIVMNAEVRTLSDGTPSEVRVVYLGLAQGYFVSPKGEAGVGTPTPQGWTWRVDRDIAPAVAQVIDVLLTKSKPKLIPLPVSIQ